MDTIVELIALCREGLRALPGLPAGVTLSLFVAGLAGSLVHCVGMCGPFVLSQVVSDAGMTSTGRYGEWQRLRGAALAPYHLGRLTTYSLLGAIAGAASAVFASTTGFAWLSGALLVLAAVLMVLQAAGLTVGVASPLGSVLARLAAPLATAHGPLRGPFARYGLGLLLGLLPCGLLYGAVAAAGGTGSGWQGALGMAAFAVGTMPALVVVGWLGLIAQRRLRGAAIWLATPLLLANAVLMLALASQRFAA